MYFDSKTSFNTINGQSCAQFEREMWETIRLDGYSNKYWFMTNSGDTINDCESNRVVSHKVLQYIEYWQR